MSQGPRDAEKPFRPSAVRNGALAIALATAASAGVAFIGASLIPQVGDVVVPAALAGFFGSAFFVLIRRKAGARKPNRVGAPATPSPAAQKSDDHLEPVGIPELVEAAGAARISRLLVPVAAMSHAAGAVALARGLAARSASTVLVDLGGQGAAQEMGLIGSVNDVSMLAASPTTFAHSIHRDRASRAHFLAGEIDPSQGDKAIEAAAAVLDALGEAYARTVAVVSIEAMERVDGLMNADTALVVPDVSFDDAAMRDLVQRLMARGIAEPIRLSIGERVRQVAAA